MRVPCVLTLLLVTLLASQAARAANPRAFELLKTAMALTPDAGILYAKHCSADGERIYGQSCAICHGKIGEGSDDEPIPAIGGQHYRYILNQLAAFAERAADCSASGIPHRYR